MASRHLEHVEDLHFRVLKLLQDDPDLSQRELANQLGVSNGKLHYCMKALIDKNVLPTLATAPQNMASALYINDKFWLEHLDKLNQRFNAWVAK